MAHFNPPTPGPFYPPRDNWGWVIASNLDKKLLKHRNKLLYRHNNGLMIELLGNTRSSSNSIYINYQLMLFLDSIKTCLKQKIDTIKIGRVSPKLYKINQGDEKESESDIEYYSQTRWYSIAIPFKNKALISVTSNSSEIEIGLRKWNEDDKRNNEYYEELEKSSKWSEIHSKYREGGDWWYFVRIDPFDDDYISQSSIERYVEELCEIYENLESISR